MKIIEIKALENGGHRNQTGNLNAVPEGYARVPDDMAIPDTFPFVNIETSDIDGVMTVTKMTAGVMPEPEQPTPSEQREQAYETMKIIEWQGEQITVDEANDLWLKYSAEGSEVANTLSELIVKAKAHIRELYPDEV